MALELEKSLVAELRAWGERALTDSALRPVEAESLHMTLAFLGERDGDAIGAVARALEGVGGPAPRLELLDPVGKGSPSRPQLFALPVRSTAAVALQAEVAGRLASQGLFRPPGSPFWPHVTVARVRREKGRSKRPMKVADRPLLLPPTIREHLFDAVRLTLYRSELGPKGARYTPLTQIELPKGGNEVNKWQTGK